jgi:sarcosine oxidase subunit beta
MKSPDVIVIGAGVVGAACAYFLTEAGLRVALIDRGGIAAGTSSRCQSNVGAGVGTLSDYPYFGAAVDTYRELRGRGFDLGYVETPSIIVATDETEAAELTAVVDELARLRGSCEMLDAQQVRELEPRLKPGFTAVALDQRAAQVNPMRVAFELAEASTRGGCQLMTGTQVLAVDVRRRRFRAVTTSAGDVTAGSVVIAGGVWSRAIAAQVGLKLPVWPRKGHIVVAEPVPGWLRHGIVEFAYESSLGHGYAQASTDAGLSPEADATVGTIVQPLPSGQMLIGSSREPSPLDTETSRWRIRQILDRACRFLPELGQLRALRSYAGLRPWTPDGRPLIGPVAGLQGLFIATGHGGGGITGGPLTGRLIAASVAGLPTPIDVSRYLPDRFGPALYDDRQEVASFEP